MIISLYHCALRRSHPILRSIDEPSPSKKTIMCCDRDVTSLNSGSYQRPSSLGTPFIDSRILSISNKQGPR